MTRSPVVFLQYIAALAIVEGIHTLDEGYDKLPVKIKWPNDICRCHDLKVQLFSQMANRKQTP